MTHKPQRYFWVDALRGIAALCIVIFHYHHFYLNDAFGRDAIPPTSEFPYANIIGPLYSSFTANAVEMFWLISGFVFAHVYIRRPTSAWQFGVARFARLYPLHFATLVYVAIIQLVSLNIFGHWQIYANNDVRHFVLQLFMSSNWTTWSRGLSFNGPIWSVSLEIVVYAMFFCSLYFLRRKPITSTIVLFLASWLVFYLHSGDFPFLSIGIFRCAGYFFLGTLVYLLHPDRSNYRLLILVLSGSMLFGLGVFFEVEDFSISGLSLAAVSLAARLDQIFPRSGIHLSTLGDISYSVYLVHVPIQMTSLVLSDFLFDGTREFAKSYLTLPIYLFISVALALFVHRRFERPAGAFIRRKLVRPRSG
jgi:peptidoglycan/LPS O-acetylase OafA/YrhL